MSVDLRPQHCPDENDSRVHLEPELKTCRTAHPIVEAAAAQVTDWLKRAAAALVTGSVPETTLPHPDPTLPAITLHGLDPSSCHIMIELARTGSEVTAGLYVDLVCQGSNGVWNGAADAYLQLCPSCNKRLTLRQSRSAAQQIRRPQGAVEVATGQWPSGLSAGEDWLGNRELRLARLPGCDPEPWQIAYLDEASRRATGALLLYTGPRLSTTASLLLVEQASDLRAVLPLLTGATAKRRLSSIRMGARSELRRLGSGPGPVVQPQHHCFVNSRSRAPAGWGVLRQVDPDGRAKAELTRTATSDVRQYLSVGSMARFEFWSAPQPGRDGAIDVRGLMAPARASSRRHKSDPNDNPRRTDMTRTARESRDPRTYRQPLPNVTGKEHTKGKEMAYGMGFQDAVNVTVAMTQDTSGQRALGELTKGNEKPYRRLAERRNPLA